MRFTTTTEPHFANALLAAIAPGPERRRKPRRANQFRHDTSRERSKGRADSLHAWASRQGRASSRGFLLHIVAHLCDHERSLGSVPRPAVLAHFFWQRTLTTGLCALLFAFAALREMPANLTRKGANKIILLTSDF
jgi:hypothetical protein